MRLKSQHAIANPASAELAVTAARATSRRLTATLQLPTASRHSGFSSMEMQFRRCGAFKIFRAHSASASSRSVVENAAHTAGGGHTSQLLQGMGLELAHPLATELQRLADLFQRAFRARVQPETRPHNIRLPRRQRLAAALHMIAPLRLDGRVQRVAAGTLGDHISELALALRDGRMKGHL